MEQDIRILIADDHAVVREGLHGLISTEPGMILAGEAADGIEAVKKAQAIKPDVILMDLSMPHMDGVAAIREIKKVDPDACILVLTSFAEDAQIFPALKAGARGYLLKDSSPQELLQAIRAVHRGESSLNSKVARKVVDRVAQPTESRLELLTEREKDVLRLVAHGLSNQEIADQLVTTERTVRSHVGSILDKLHLVNRTQAALFALRTGLAHLDES